MGKALALSNTGDKRGSGGVAIALVMKIKLHSTDVFVLYMSDLCVQNCGEV